MKYAIPPKVIEVCNSVFDPTYIYDLSELRETAIGIKNAFKSQEATVLFATMANPHPEILQALNGVGIGACVNSIAHLDAARRAGISHKRIQFTSSNLSTRDLEVIGLSKVQCNVDSAGQAEALTSVSAGLVCGVRINTRALLGQSVSTYDRLGVDPNEITAISSIVKSKSGHLNGAHIYVGTNFRSHLEMLPALDRFFSVAANFPDLEYVNVGGGIGVDYTRRDQGFDVGSYAEAIGQRLETLRTTLRRHVQLVVEPGRAMVASSGFFTCRVTDIKKLGQHTFVGVNASVAQFPRPWHQPEISHRVYTGSSANNKSTDDEGETVEAVIAGRTTYSKDVLSTARLPQNLGVGDALIFADAGAYCDSMASKFLGQPEAASLILN